MNRVVNVKHYIEAVIRGITSGTLLRTTRRYLGYRRIERAVAARYGLTVQAGPFEGMKYIPVPPNHAFTPKILGFFEQELHPSLAKAMSQNYNVVINIGSAEGYYTVGLARQFPRAKVYAFDIDEREQVMCRLLAQENEVADRVTVRGLFRAEDFQTLIEGRALVFIDCEGCEFDVLVPDVAPKLAQADLMIEVHDFNDSTRIGDTLKARFGATHDLTIVPSKPRRPEDHPAIAFLPDDVKILAVTEREVIQNWYYLRSRTAR